MSDRVKYFRFKLGCDPELFLADIDGQLKASCGLIGGTKENPQPLTVLGDGYAVQEDNVAIEFNIPAAESRRDFIDSIAKTMKVLQDGVNNSLGFHLDQRSWAEFPKDQLESPAAKIFGCDPDYNAWTGEQNPKPKADDETLRTCGGHIHVGYDSSQVEKKRLIKFMDMLLGVPAVIMDAEGARRRELYGMPGAYRDKPYGVEYRSLSNFWVAKKDPALTGWVWNQTARAMDYAISPFNIDAERDRIINTIKNNDKNEAMKMCNQFQLEILYV